MAGRALAARPGHRASTPRAAWRPSSTSRPVTCSRWRRCAARPAGQAARVAAPTERNSPLTDLFEPGSTNKLVTLSWAIEHGFVKPDTMFTVPWTTRIDPHVKPYKDDEWHPPMRWTTADILRESSNVGTIEIARRMRNQDVADALRAFGLGTRTVDRRGRVSPTGS